MVKTSFVFLFLVLICNNNISQRISTGFSLGTNAFQKITLPSNFLYPQNSYFIYYTANQDNDDKPIYNNYFKGWMAGLNLSIDYKRIMISSEIMIATQKFTIPALYPNSLGGLLGSSWSNFETNRLSGQFNLLTNIRLTTKANGFYVQFGAQVSYNSYKEVRGTLNTDIADAVWLFISDYEMYGIIYTNQRNYFNGLAGIGFKNNDHYYTLRYSKRLFQNKNSFPLASFYSIDFVISQTLNFQKLKKGYKIYLD